MKFLNTNKFFNRYLPLGLSVILLVAAGFFWQVYTARASYTYTRSITLQSSQIPANQTNFTVLICANFTMGNGNACPTVAGLNQTGGGAHVQNSSGYDITFWTASNCTGAMNWQMENYVPSTGEMEAWVLITSLSTSGNTIYMCYGNSSISSFQGGAVGSAWDGNYKVIYHMADNAANTTVTDSSSSTNNATNSVNTNTKTTSGQVDGALNYTLNSSNYAVSNGLVALANNVTFSVWVKTGSVSSYSRIMETQYNTSYYLGDNTNGTKFDWIVNSGSSFENCIGGTANSSWHYVVGTYDGTTAHLYVDGSQVCSYAGFTAPGATNDNLYISKYDGGSSNYWDGPLDELRVSSTNRSANWVTTEYNNESAPNTFETFGSETNNSTSGGNFTRVSMQNMRASIQNARVSITGN